MNGFDLILYEEEFKRIGAELQNLHRQANAKVVVLVDKNKRSEFGSPASPGIQ